MEYRYKLILYKTKFTFIGLLPALDSHRVNSEGCQLYVHNIFSDKAGLEIFRLGGTQFNEIKVIATRKKRTTAYAI